MKKLLSLILAGLFLIGACAMAEDTGVVMITSPDAAGEEAVNLDDVKAGDQISVPGYGNITIVSAEFCDKIANDGSSYSSGTEAEYFRIRFRILNTQKKPVNFRETLGEVTCDYGDGYQFGGWARQETKGDGSGKLYKNEADAYEVDVLYEGYFDVVVTLPNFVVESKEPLSVTFHLGESELTYNVRQ